MVPKVHLCVSAGDHMKLPYSELDYWAIYCRPLLSTPSGFPKSQAELFPREPLNWSAFELDISQLKNVCSTIVSLNDAWINC